MSNHLTHIDEHGRARMVDVTSKPLTHRVAMAKCAVISRAAIHEVLTAAPDGLDIVETARIAGIQGAKLTSSLIPLCHSIRIDHIEVGVVVHPHRVDVTAVTEITERTGVEMEALTACGIAGATLLRALLKADPEASMEELTLWHKSGGRSGNWQRAGADDRLTRDPAADMAKDEPPAPG